MGQPYAQGSSRGGRAEMTLSSRDIQQVTFVSKITHLCLGCRFTAPDPAVDAAKRRANNAGGYHSQFVLDLRTISLNVAGPAAVAVLTSIVFMITCICFNYRCYITFNFHRLTPSV